MLLKLSLLLLFSSFSLAAEFSHSHKIPELNCKVLQVLENRDENAVNGTLLDDTSNISVVLKYSGFEENPSAPTVLDIKQNHFSIFLSPRLMKSVYLEEDGTLRGDLPASLVTHIISPLDPFGSQYWDVDLAIDSDLIGGEIRVRHYSRGRLFSSDRELRLELECSE